MACIRNKITRRRRHCVIADKHLDIMAVMIDVHLGWTKPYAYHMICMHRFKDKILKNLVCRAALATEVGKFNKRV